MRKIKPNIYAEAFGILHRIYEKEDCRNTLENLLAKTPLDKKEYVCEIFEPVIEMMERCLRSCTASCLMRTSWFLSLS